MTDMYDAFKDRFKSYFNGKITQIPIHGPHGILAWEEQYRKEHEKL